MREKLVLLTLLSLLSASGSHAASLFRAIELGSLDGGPTFASAINNLGQIVGTSGGFLNERQAFIYSNGVMTALHGASDGAEVFGSVATDINDNGQITGYARFGGSPNQAFITVDGVITNLGIERIFSSGNGINNLGQVAGDMSSGLQITYRAFVRTDGVTRDLGNLGGLRGALAYDVNDGGEATGTSHYVSATGPSGYQAFLTFRGSMVHLGTLGGNTSSGNAINNLSQVAGTSDTTDGQHAFIAEMGSQMTDLGTLGGKISNGLGLNDLGQVVGTSTLTSETEQQNDPRYRAFLFEDGEMFDLNTLIIGDFDGTLLNAPDINNLGQIVANGLNADGQRRAYLLTPVPLPSAITLFGSVLLGFFGLQRRTAKPGR